MGLVIKPIRSHLDSRLTIKAVSAGDCAWTRTRRHYKELEGLLHSQVNMRDNTLEMITSVCYHSRAGSLSSMKAFPFHYGLCFSVLLRGQVLKETTNLSPPIRLIYKILGTCPPF